MITGLFGRCSASKASSTRGCRSTAACFAFRRVPRTSCSPLPSGPAPGRRGFDTSRLRHRKNPQGRCSVRQAPQTVTSCPDRRDRRLPSRGLSCFEVDAPARGESGFRQTRPAADDRAARGRRATSMVDTIARISSQSVSGSRMRDHSPQRSAATRPWRLRGYRRQTGCASGARDSTLRSAPARV